MKKLIIVLTSVLLCTGCSANSVDMFGAGSSSEKTVSLYGNKQSYVLDNYDIKQVTQPYDLVLSDQDFSGPDNATGVDNSFASVILNEQQVANTGGSGLSKNIQESSEIEEFDFIFPVDFACNPVFTDHFGARNTLIPGASTFHRGIDIGCPTGTAIYAVADGTVSFSGYNGGAGYMVTIDHGLNKKGSMVQTTYMHNSELCVSVGQKINQGDKIAEAGNTGTSGGSHCHFQLTIGGKSYNSVLAYKGSENVPGKRNGKFVKDGSVGYVGVTQDKNTTSSCWEDMIEYYDETGALYKEK